MNAIVVVVAIVLVASAVADLGFTYADQGAWPQLPGSQCGGQHQSPIDIDLRFTDINHGLAHSLVCSWHRFDAVLDGMLINTGRTVELDVSGPSAAFCVGLPGRGPLDLFLLARVHVHFAQTVAAPGTEHRLNGRAGALELHLIHFDARYGTWEEAARHPDGLVVVALLYEQQPEGRANSELSRLALTAGLMLPQSRTQTAYRLHVRPLLVGTGVELGAARFFTYRGSLTTPTCNEAVTWIVASQPGAVGCKSMQLLRAVLGLDGAPMAPIIRDLQPLNGRRIQSSFVW